MATTNTQGGKIFPSDLVDELAGADVVVVLDRDATGWARGVDLHTKLTAAGAKVSLRLPAVLEDKADFTDHIEAGFTLEDIPKDWVAFWSFWCDQVQPAVAGGDHLVRIAGPGGGGSGSGSVCVAEGPHPRPLSRERERGEG